MGIEPTGRSLDLRGMDLIDIQNGRVAANHIYYDQLTFARQVGMLPSEGSLGDRLMSSAFNIVTKARAAVEKHSGR